MKVASGVSGRELPRDAVRETAEKICRELGTRPEIVFAYWSTEYDSKELAAELREVFSGKTKIFGATSCQGVMSDQGFLGSTGAALGVLAISDPGGCYGVGLESWQQSPREASKRALENALENAGRPGETPELVWISSAPGDEEKVLLGLEDVLGPNVPVIGGSAGDNTIAGEWFQVANCEGGPQTVCVAVLFPTTPLGFAFHSGYLPTSASGVVTKASGRVIREIEGRPAAEVYNAWTGGAIGGFLGTESNILAPTSLNPLGRVVGEVGGVPYFQLSHPASISKDGSLALFSEVVEGEELVLMEGTKDTLVSRAGRVVQAAIESVVAANEDAAGALLAYCAGCMLTVAEEMPRVVESVREPLLEAPFLGFFSFGEQGCFLGGENKHGNLMISGIIFSKGDEQYD